MTALNLEIQDLAGSRKAYYWKFS